MRFLATADLHLTARSRDAYRWDFMEWFEDQIREHKPDFVFVLGDLTHAKDHHSAKLVNGIVRALRSWACWSRVFVLKGNHDYTDPDLPFFDFLAGTEASKWPVFVTKTMIYAPATRSWGKIMFIPHGDSIGAIPKNVKLCLCHHTFKGSRAAGGFRLESGVSTKCFDQTNALVLSGDVHVPQKVGPVHYIGAPYPINFGDVHVPRVVYWDGEHLESIPVPTIRKLKMTLEDPDELMNAGLNPGDQIKIVLRLPRSEFADWDTHKARVQSIAADQELNLFGIELTEKKSRKRVRLSDPEAKAPVRKSPTTVLEDYCQAKALAGEIREAGLEVLDHDDDQGGEA